MSQRRLRCFAIFAIALSLVQQACGDGGTEPDGGSNPATLALTARPPEEAQSGVAFPLQPAVQLRNANGETVKRAGVVITAAISAGGGTLGGTSTAVTTSEGSAAFSNLSITGAPGVRFLTFSAAGLTSTTATVTIFVAASFQSLLAGNAYSCGLEANGAAYCWGFNNWGTLGNGNISQRLTPVAVSGPVFQSVAPGNMHACAVRSGGTVYCWGYNGSGQLGDGTTSSRLTATAVAGGWTFQSVSAGLRHTCALTVGGTAYCWGSSPDGQLGEGTTTDRSTPVAVAGGLVFQRVTVGESQSCGLTTDSRAYCWGDNGYGQLGDGTTADRSTPVAVAGGMTFQSLDAGTFHTCGVRTGGTAFCWGDNNEGQLGDGTVRDQSIPAVVGGGGLTFQSVSAGDRHSCGVTTSGAGYCWGYNGFGQLGDGTPWVPGTGVDRSRPFAVVGGLTFQSISAGSDHSCGLTSDAIGYCWGFNTHGGLGDGTTTDRTSPVAVRAP